VQLSPRLTAHHEIRSRLLSGERVCDIARALGMQPQMVANRCYKIYKKHGVTKRKDLLAKLQTVLTPIPTTHTLLTMNK
jgi:DNA-binding CsgD family transcriptional regulator